MKRTLQQINEHASELQGQIAAASGRREAISLALVEDPKNSAIRKALDATDKEIADLSRELAVHQDARSAAARRDGVATRATHLKSLQRARDAAVEAAQQRAALGGEIATLCEKLKAVLQRWQVLTDQCRADAFKVARDGLGDRLPLDGHNVLSAANGETGGVPHAFASALISAGVGTTGIPMPGVFAAFGGSNISIEEAASIDANRVSLYLNEMLEAVEKREGKVADAVEAENLHAFGRINTIRELIVAPLKKDE